MKSKSYILLLTAIMTLASAIAAFAGPAPAPAPHPLPPSAPYAAGQGWVRPQAQVSPDAAEKIAFDYIGGTGVLVKQHFKVDKRGYAKYDTHIFKDGVTYKIDIDAMSGAILKYEVKQQLQREYYGYGGTQPSITREQAEKTAFGVSNGGTIVKYELKYEKKTMRPCYDIHVVSNNVKYDFKIDGLSGQIYKMKQENVRIY